MMRRFWKYLTCVTLTTALCAGGLPAPAAGAAESREERQKAIVATALAYFDKGISMQYDGITLVDDIERSDGGKTRSTNQEAPEYATKYETLYSVCSDFPHQVYWETFRYQLCGSAGACWTGKLAKTPEDDPMFVYSYKQESGKDVHEAIHEMMALAQPGDVITAAASGGHSMLYVGDVFGNGVKYLAHCFGVSIKMDTGADSREYPKYDPTADPRYGYRGYSDSKGGSIRLTPDAEAYIDKSYGKDSYKLITLVRPLNAMKDGEYPVTAATKYRMTHPRLAIDRVVEEKTRFLSAVPGEKLTLTVTLHNSAKTPCAVPVTERVPAGVKLLKTPDGAAVAGDAITWNVELPAEGEKRLAVEYEVTAKRGEQIVFTGGSVGDIPSNTIPITVGGVKLNAEDRAKLLAIANGDYDGVLAGVKDADLGTTVYQKILGYNVTLPTLRQVREKLSYEKTDFQKGKKALVFKGRDEVAAEDLQLYAYLVPMLHGGLKYWNEWGHERCNDPKDLHLEPGDIVVRAKDPTAKLTSTSTLVYLGEGKYLMYDPKIGGYPIVDEPELVASLTYGGFWCLRPTLAFDDIHTIGGTAVPASPYRNPFTDVRESDWFYPYVKELVRSKLVQGMTETTFAPQGTLTYGQALKLIALAVGEKEPEKSGDHWASGYLKLAKDKKWLEENVNLDDAITRQAFCQIAAKARELSYQPFTNPFTDTEDKDVLALYRAGVINGMTEKTFEPDGKLTRAQVCKIIGLLRLRKGKI